MELTKEDQKLFNNRARQILSFICPRKSHIPLLKADKNANNPYYLIGKFSSKNTDNILSNSERNDFIYGLATFNSLIKTEIRKLGIHVSAPLSSSNKFLSGSDICRSEHSSHVSETTPTLLRIYGDFIKQFTRNISLLEERSSERLKEIFNQYKMAQQIVTGCNSSNPNFSSQLAGNGEVIFCEKDNSEISEHLFEEVTKLLKTEFVTEKNESDFHNNCFIRTKKANKSDSNKSYGDHKVNNALIIPLEEISEIATAMGLNSQEEFERLGNDLRDLVVAESDDTNKIHEESRLQAQTEAKSEILGAKATNLKYPEKTQETQH